jgi:hypothetical protein
MNVPIEIAMLIALKKEVVLAEEAQREANRAKERTIAIEKSREVLQQKIAERLLSVPDSLRPYDVTEKQWSDDELENEGRRNSSFAQLKLLFEIPGLSMIAQDVKGNWAAAYPVQSCNEAPEIGFFRDTYFITDLGIVLIGAKENLERFAELNSEYQEHLEWQRKMNEENQLREQNRNADQAIQMQARETEEKALFEAFENDPVAIQLLKAFLMIRQERNMFEERISNADETLCSVEERWSRKAADLRRQANDAERHANLEHEHARNLEDEKDDIEKRLKKAERGGW